MSTMINLRPLIAKTVRDLLESQDTILDVDSVYAELVTVYGDEIFESERELARIAVRQKIKSHLKSAHSADARTDGEQTTLLPDTAPAALAIRMPDGGYGYVPLRAASVADVEAATKNKIKNIDAAQASLKKWREFIKPIVRLMKRDGITFGEAEAKAATAKPRRKRKTG